MVDIWSVGKCDEMVRRQSRSLVLERAKLVILFQMTSLPTLNSRNSNSLLVLGKPVHHIRTQELTQLLVEDRRRQNVLRSQLTG